MLMKEIARGATITLHYAFAPSVYSHTVCMFYNLQLNSFYLEKNNTMV